MRGQGIIQTAVARAVLAYQGGTAENLGVYLASVVAPRAYANGFDISPAKEAAGVCVRDGQKRAAASDRFLNSSVTIPPAW